MSIAGLFRRRPCRSADPTRRNILLLSLDGMFFQTGYNFLNAASVLSVLIQALTGSMMLAGLCRLLESASLNIGRMVGGPYTRRVRNQPLTLGVVSAAIRPLFLVIVPFLLYNPSDGAVVTAILAIVAAHWFIVGTIGMLWDDSFARMLSPAQRGRVLAIRMVLGGLLSLAGGAVMAAILGSPVLSVRQQYAVILPIGVVLMLLCFPCIACCKDRSRPLQAPLPPIWRLLPQLPRTLRENPRYLGYLPGRLLGYVTEAMVPFVLLICNSLQPMTGGQTGMIVYLYIIGKMAGGMMLGWCSGRFGNRGVALLMQGLAAFQFAALLILQPLAPVPMALLYGLSLLCGVASTLAMGSYLYLMDIAPSSRRIQLLTVETTIMLPMTALPLLLGSLLDVTGFAPPLMAALTVALLTMALLRWRWLDKPALEALHDEINDEEHLTIQ